MTLTPASLKTLRRKESRKAAARLIQSQSSFYLCVLASLRETISSAGIEQCIKAPGESGQSEKLSPTRPPIHATDPIRCDRGADVVAGPR